MTDRNIWALEFTNGVEVASELYHARLRRRNPGVIDWLCSYS